MNTTLYSFRLYRKWEAEEVANALTMPTDEYEALEAGAEIIDAEMAQRFADLYKVPPGMFLSDQRVQQVSFIYSHNHFENSNAYVNHLHQDSSKLLERLVAEKGEQLQLLKEEVMRLRKENSELLNRLLEK
jgi:transcriptional regulator with XRE-family HTH domain